MLTKTRMLAGALALAVLAAGAANAETDRLITNAMRYDLEYPVIQYSGPATENRISRLQRRIDKGEVKLQWEPKFGYLRSMLKALDIDPSSQTFVFSKTSLQTTLIAEKTPRAVFFNDDTYVGFVQGSDLMEFAAADARSGLVFHGMINRQDTSPKWEREGGRCLTCHDTYSMMGGGVPRVMVMSAPVDDPSDPRTFSSASEVDDRTPIAERWGGWYVSGWYLPGSDGKQVPHLGNLPLRAESSIRESDRLKALVPTRDNRGNVEGYFDTSHYISDKSDVVALLVLEHQTFVQNLITRASFKIRTLATREGQATPVKKWSDLDQKQQAASRQVMEPLLRAIFFADAVPLAGQVVTSSGYSERFAARGPKDSEGRSLRDMQLNKRLFRYPLSYMVYSETFNSLPAYALEYIDGRIVDVLQGRDERLSGKLTAEEREAISHILSQTHPRFAARLGKAVAAR